MARHTPGPWIWNRGRPKKYDLDWLEGSGARVFTIYSNGEITPDKALIAAAPDLLSELEAAIAWIAEFETMNICAPHAPTAAEILPQLRAAIAKATQS